MTSSANDQASIFSTLASIYYQVVPERYKTYCALTAAISQRTLAHVGVEAHVLACQVWCVTPTQNYVVGFSGNTGAGRWTGHAVCTTDDWFIDAAMNHFQREFGVNAPDAVAGRRFKLPTQAISRYDLSPSERLWWMRAPHDVDTTIPTEPEELISACSEALTQKLKAALQRG